MRIRIVAVGKVSSFYKPILFEYQKRVSKYCDMEILEIPEGKGDTARVKRQEAVALLKLIPEGFHAIALDVKGKRVTSEEFAGSIRDIMDKGKNICFLMGGSEGFDDALLKSVDESISFSDMTFTHQMARVMLMEQVYRAFKIIKNEPYHK